MPRKSKPANSTPYSQLPIDFNTVIESAQVLSREEVALRSHGGGESGDYDPVAQTADYMRRAVQLEESWETTLQRAREELMAIDAREIYFQFILDLKKQIESSSTNSARLAKLLEQVAVRGLGMTRKQLSIEKPLKGGTRWRVNLNPELVRTHLDQHIVGDHFLNPVDVADMTWKASKPYIGASDVSQHRSAVPVPARFFKRSVPFVLNNAAGTLFKIDDGQAKYENVFNPRPDDALLRWMLIDPSYQDELEPEDYERCLASAMDVGQYKFDLEFLLKADRRVPDVIFRDGTLFPQDAYLDNFVVESRRGEFTREAIVEMLNCLIYSREVDSIYCGVSKNVQLKVYSALLDWYVERYIDSTWRIGNYTLNDGQAMTLLLSSPSFTGTNLERAFATCLIRRSFTTRANLNTKLSDLDDLESYLRNYQTHCETDITPYRRLCSIGHVYMFFIGHARTPQQQLPRYEFFYTDSLGPLTTAASKVLSALQYCGLMNDDDHSFMSDKPVTYLIPSVTQQAHLLSKDVGKYVDTATGQWIMARYQSYIR